MKKIRFVGGLDPKIFFEYNDDTRFVVISTPGGVEIEVHQLDALHIELFRQSQKERLPEEITFVGGGYCSRFGTRFDSTSCYEIFGFDCPKDERLQKKIIEKIEEFFNSL